jgi:uncharacterized protein DUF397
MTHWRKSTHSNVQTSCVELSHTATMFGVRDSKLTRSPILTLGTEHGIEFIVAVKTGQFDR